MKTTTEYPAACSLVDNDTRPPDPRGVITVVCMWHVFLQFISKVTRGHKGTKAANTIHVYNSPFSVVFLGRFIPVDQAEISYVK